MMFEGDGTAVQYCFLVNDIDRAIDRWIRTTGAGPFFLRRRIDDLDIRYRGQPSRMDLSIALGQLGGAHVELIQQHNDGPTVYRDTFAPGAEGFHHIAMIAKDLDAALNAYTADGHEIGMEGVFGSTRFAYVDTRSAIGAFTELLQETDELEFLYKTVADAALDWDGSDPVRAF